MNKMLVAIFDNETAASQGLHALRQLHAEGDITLYATGVISRNEAGQVVVREAAGAGPLGTGIGLAVGSMIGLLGGPVGVALGAVAGSVIGAVRDYWVAGVGLDFVAQAEKLLLPGKVALVAEIDEEWVIPVDTALAAAGGHVVRRNRSELAEEQYDHDIAAFRSEIQDLEAEAAQAGDNARAALQGKLAAARQGLDAASQQARQHVDALRHEAAAKAESLTAQMNQARGDAKARIDARVQHMKTSYHLRGAKLSQAWALAKEALAG